MIDYAFAAYYLPLPPEGHQLDQLSDYLCKEEAQVDTEDWPECTERIHGWHQGEAHFLCMHPDCAHKAKRVLPKDCRGCPVRCGR